MRAEKIITTKYNQVIQSHSFVKLELVNYLLSAELVFDFNLSTKPVSREDTNATVAWIANMPYSSLPLEGTTLTTTHPIRVKTANTTVTLIVQLVFMVFFLGMLHQKIFIPIPLMNLFWM